MRFALSYEALKMYGTFSARATPLMHSAMLERMLFALNDAGTGDQEQLTAADLNIADLERQFHVSSFSFRVGCPFHIRET